jgi:hypothetical protein
MSIINPLPYTFQNGTTADATQINADFAQIVNNVNTNVPTLLSASAPVTTILITGTSLTYNTPLDGAGRLPLYLEVEMWGPGGGGGEGNAVGTAGGDGTAATVFGTLSAGFGKGGGNNGPGGDGGLASGGDINIKGSRGQGSPPPNATGQGGMGGPGPYGGAALPGLPNTAGLLPAANSGSGGTGGGSTGSAGTGGGGGAGGYLKKRILTPTSSYTYTVGLGGAASTGTGNHGAKGADGLISVTAHWQ